MTKLSLYSKVIITCLIAFVGLIFFISKVSAQSSYEVIDHSIEVDLFENGDAYFRAELTIINNDPNNVVSGYNYVLPAKNVINPTVEFDGQTMSLPVYAQPGSSFSNLEIDFGDNVIKPNSAKKIVINAKLSSFVKLNFEAKYILFQPTKDQINSFAISYPASFGVPLYISDSNAEQKQNNASIDSIKLSSTKNLVLIMWGDEYYVDVQTESQISNRADKPVQTLFELIPDTQSQLVAYNNITNGEFGLRDTYGNDFATLNLAAAESKNIGFEARIKKVQSSLEKNISTKYEINLPKLFSEDLSNRTLDNILAKENLENIYDYLIETYPLEFTQTKEADIQNFDEYLQNKKSLNSFDYSAVLATYAESLGLDAEIRYGYVVLKPGEETTLQPHFWVVVFSDEDSYIIDPYMEITTELHYFNLKYDFDRITFGVWHPGQRYNSALGLITTDSGGGVKKLEINKIDSFENPDANLEIKNPGEVNRLSGFYYTQNIEVFNPSSAVIAINKIVLDGKEKDIHELLDDLEITLLPKTNNLIPLPEVRNENFFFAGSKNEEVVIDTDSVITPEIELKYKVEYKRDKDFMVIIAVTGVIIVFVIWRTINRIRRGKWKKLLR